MKNVDGMNADGAESMFILITLEKIKEMRLKFSHGSVTVLKIMTSYQEARVKLKNTQLIKVKIRLKKYDRNNIKNE